MKTKYRIRKRPKTKAKLSLGTVLIINNPVGTMQKRERIVSNCIH